jgi:hypothetical protein
MDENKKKRLEEIGYEINPCCGLCMYGKFKGTMFGDCTKHSYVHLKHSADKKNLSINVYGVCEDFEYDKKLEGQLHKFTEFLVL